ncbi:MFS transporter [Synergistales bacterium]|nr:MFS transporter [Synergistales bacterium]
MVKVNETERWLRLAFGVIVLLFAGIIYAWTVLNTPFAKPLDAGGEFGWTKTQLSLNYTITIVFFCLGGFVAGLLTKKTTPRARLIAGAALLSAGFFITSRLTASGLTLLYLSYGVMCGLGVGLAYTTIIGLTSAWFPDKKGVCSGILLMGFGLTTLVIGGLAKGMIANESIGWRGTYTVLAIALGVVFLLAGFIIRAPREGTVFPEPKAKNAQFGAAAARDYSAAEMIKRVSFWKLFILITLIAAVGSAAIALARDLLEDLSVADPAAIIGVISIFNGLGRLASGTLFDRVGVRKTQYFIAIFALAAPAAVALSTLVGSSAIAVIGLCLCYFSYGFAPTISSVFASAFYGTKSFSLNFSILNLILIPAPFAATLAASVRTSSGSFLVPFAILTGCALIGGIINLSIRQA